MDANLQEIETAIMVGNKAVARELLRPILEHNPTADAWLLAAKASVNDQETLHNLQKALELDPQHIEARLLYTKLQEFIGPATQTPTGEIDTRSESISLPPSNTHTELEDITNSGEGVYEMLWDCRFCGTEKLLGKTHKFCPNCGSPQDPSWRYFPADEDKIAVRDHVFVGADIQCENCTNLNPGNAEFCSRCGAPLKGGGGVQTQGKREKMAGQRFEGEDLKARINAKLDYEAGRAVDSIDKRPRRTAYRKFMPYMVIGVLVSVLGVILFAIMATDTKTVSVSQQRWVYEVEVERLNTIDERRIGSCFSVAPSDAYSERERREQIDTRRVQDGETCRNVQVDQGDGTFRQERQCQPKYREEPIMGDVCYYKINRWQTARMLTNEGLHNSLINPPALSFDCLGDQVGCEREGDHTVRYVLQFGSGDDSFECPVDESLWREVSIESVFTVEFGVVGGGPRCSTLRLSN